MTRYGVEQALAFISVALGQPTTTADLEVWWIALTHNEFHDDVTDQDVMESAIKLVRQGCDFFPQPADLRRILIPLHEFRLACDVIDHKMVLEQQKELDQ